MSLSNDDLQAIAQIVNNGTNLVLGELDRVEQKIYRRFDKTELDMQAIREDIHITRYSNDTVELLLKKVAELERRMAEIEKTA